MKKLLIILTAALIPMIAGAQAQITTKKVKISDFTEKITKVVLTGNDFYDLSLQDEVKARWRVSPYEFCTWEEFMNDRNSSDYYFLITTSSQFKKESEPGLDLLSLLKGGTGATINSMMEVMYMPLASSEDPSGREYVFLKAFLDVIQSYALTSMEKDINAYTGLPNYTMNITKSGEMTLVFSESDLSSEITDEVKQACFDDSVLVLEEDAADEFMTPEQTNVLVSYVAVPASKQPGSFCYKMLIDPQTNTLYYFRKHKISKKFGAGFLAEDIKRITAPRKK